MSRLRAGDLLHVATIVAARWTVARATCRGLRRGTAEVFGAPAVLHPSWAASYARGVSAADVVVVVAAGIGSLGAIVSLAAAFVLVNQVRRLERGVEALRHEALLLVEEAHAAAGHAATEIARVDAVLADTEVVTATVDHAARIARRAFANPVVKVLAWRAGAVGGLRRLRGAPDRQSASTAGTRGDDRHGGDVAIEAAALPASRRTLTGPR